MVTAVNGSDAGEQVGLPIDERGFLRMKPTLRQALPISRPPARRSATVLMAAMLVALSMVLSACDFQMEEKQRGYVVDNYSSASYVVQISFEDGTDYDRGVPPKSSVAELGGSDPGKAVVYDESCLTTLTTVSVSGPWAVIYIDEAGHISTSAPTGPLSTESLTNMRPRPVPSTCPGLHAQPTHS